jgi:hypothetical protein
MWHPDGKSAHRMHLSFCLLHNSALAAKQSTPLCDTVRSAQHELIPAAGSP